MKFHPHQVIRAASAWFGSNASIQRGSPAPFGPEEKRPAQAMQHLAPFGVPLKSPRLPDYNNFAAARYPITTGQLLYDPIGQGWIPSRPFGPGMRRTGSYLNGAIFWNTTPQNNGVQPTLGVLYTPAQLAQIYGYMTATAITATPDFAAPGGVPTGGFGT